MQQYFLYILYSAKLDKHYIGYTGESVSKRLSEHLSNHHGFTGTVKDWEIVFTKSFNTKTEAMAEEKKLKSWKSKARVTAYILRSSTD